MGFEDREVEYGELLANVRRLTVKVLDELDEGSRNRTLDNGEKRLLSSTGTRLLRLWRIILRERGSLRAIEDLRAIDSLHTRSNDSREERA